MFLRKHFALPAIFTRVRIAQIWFGNVAIWWFIWRVTYTSTFLSYWNTASPIGTWPDQAGFADIFTLRSAIPRMAFTIIGSIRTFNTITVVTGVWMAMAGYIFTVIPISDEMRSTNTMIINAEGFRMA